MRYSLIKFRVHLLDERTFVVYIDHASLRTAMKSLHLSQQMTCCLFFLSPVQLRSETTILVMALSRRHDYDPRSALGRHEVDYDEYNDRCAMLVSLNLT